MTTPESTVTANQVFMLAAHANDRRVVLETRTLCAAHDVDPDYVAAITHLPGNAGGGRGRPKLRFAVYVLDADDQRVRVHNDDGEPVDGKPTRPWHYLTRDLDRPFTGKLPTWWAQATRADVMPLAA